MKEEYGRQQTEARIEPESSPRKHESAKEEGVI
jgi:hypothetical protein